MKEQGKTPEELTEMEIGTTLRDQKSTIEKEILPKYKYMEAKQYVTKTQWLTKEVKEETKKIRRQMKMKKQ